MWLEHEGEGGYRQGKLSSHCSPKSPVPTCQKPFQSPYLSPLSSPCSSQQPSAKLGREEHKEHPSGPQSFREQGDSHAWECPISAQTHPTQAKF